MTKEERLGEQRGGANEMQGSKDAQRNLGRKPIKPAARPAKRKASR